MSSPSSGPPAHHENSSTVPRPAPPGQRAREHTPPDLLVHRRKYRPPMTARVFPPARPWQRLRKQRREHFVGNGMRRHDKAISKARVLKWHPARGLARLWCARRDDDRRHSWVRIANDERLVVLKCVTYIRHNLSTRLPYTSTCTETDGLLTYRWAVRRHVHIHRFVFGLETR